MAQLSIEKNELEEKLIDKNGNVFDKELTEKILYAENEKSNQILFLSRVIYINELRYREKIKKFQYKNEVYLISVDWYKKFKEYINYNLIKKTCKHPEIYITKKPILYNINLDLNPGKIKNEILLINNNEKCLFDENYLIINNDKINRIDYKIFPKESFDILNKEFGCDYIIKRQLKEDKLNRRNKYDIYSKKFSVLFLPIKDLIDKNNDIENFNIYFPNLLSDEEINVYLSNIINSPNNKEIKEKLGLSAKENLNSEIKIYKLYNDNLFNDFKEFFYKNISKIKEGNKISGNLFLEKISQNFQIQELQYNILIIEFSKNKNGDIFDFLTTDISNSQSSIPRKNIKNILNNKKIIKLELDTSDEEKKTKRPNNKFNEYKLYNIERRNNLKKYSLNKKENKKGLVGLNNIGNTCFMNTSLQCLSNCQILTNYFLNDYYIPFVNKNNPIGSKGKLVESYVELIKHLWYGNENSIEPYDFKETIGEINIIFKGYQQHDTHEFLSFLLDELHEDLNKVLNKPYISINENLHFNNEIQQFQYFQKLFLSRNQSLIVDLFYGMFKSTVYCINDNCKYISNTFDPYSIISLPLINKKIDNYSNNEFLIKKEIDVYFVYQDLKKKILFFNIQIHHKMSIRNFKEKIDYMLRCGINNFELYLLKDNIPFLIDENKEETIYDLLKKDTIYLNEIPNNVFEEKNKETNENYNLIINNHKILYEREKEFDEGKKDNFNHKEYYFDKNKFIRCVFFNFSYLIENLDEEEKNNYTSKDMIYFPKVFYFNIEWNNLQIFNYLIKYFRFIYDENNNENYKELYFNQYEINSYKINEISNFELTFSIHEKINYPFIIFYFNSSKIYEEINIENEKEELMVVSENNFSIKEEIEKIKENLLENEKISDYQLNFKLVWSINYLKKIEEISEQEKIENEEEKKNIFYEKNEDELNLLDLLENFGKKEKLTEENKWFCPKCKKEQLAEKKIEIFTIPEILILHLKRFKNNLKLGNLVNFPIENLDMEKYIIYNEKKVNNNLYDLFAVANHYGGLNGGHYISYCKNFLNNKWFEFNDSFISEIHQKKIVSSSAYLLFYKRKNSFFQNIENLYNQQFQNIVFQENEFS